MTSTGTRRPVSRPRHLEWTLEASSAAFESAAPARRRRVVVPPVVAQPRNGRPECLDPTSPDRKWYAYGGDVEDIWAGAYEDQALNTD